MAQIEYIADMCHKFHIPQPKISLIHCTEKVDERHFPFTEGYMELKQMAKDGKFGNCIVDGPLDLKTSCSAEALNAKKLESPIGGEADALIFPDIEAGNVFYKAITALCSDRDGSRSTRNSCSRSIAESRRHRQVEVL